LISLLLLALVACGEDAGDYEPWPIPITGIDGGRSLDAGARDSAVDASDARFR
jgi:hypothetical protein